MAQSHCIQAHASRIRDELLDKGSAGFGQREIGLWRDKGSRRRGAPNHIDHGG